MFGPFLWVGKELLHLCTFHTPTILWAHNVLKHKLPTVKRAECSARNWGYIIIRTRISRVCSLRPHCIAPYGVHESFRVATLYTDKNIACVAKNQQVSLPVSGVAPHDIANALFAQAKKARSVYDQVGKDIGERSVAFLSLSVSTWCASRVWYSPPSLATLNPMWYRPFIASYPQSNHLNPTTSAAR